jgi:hypothetical protein
VALLEADDFEKFLAVRRSALLQLISDAMGKPIEPAAAAPEDTAEPEASDDDLDDE